MIRVITPVGAMHTEVFDPMATSKQIVPSRSRRLPSATYFESDATARAAVMQCARIQHSSFESLTPERLSGEVVFVLAEPELFAQHLKKLRAPNFRVIV